MFVSPSPFLELEYLLINLEEFPFFCHSFIYFLNYNVVLNFFETLFKINGQHLLTKQTIKDRIALPSTIVNGNAILFAYYKGVNEDDYR